MMTSRERVLRTLEFNSPDRIPVDLWVLPKARLTYGEAFDTLYHQSEKDIVSIAGPFDHGYTPEYYQLGKYTDPWGSVWTNMQAGIIGEVKEPVFADYENMEGYEPPVAQFLSEWAEARDGIAAQIARARDAGKFVIGGWISLFERMQYLRGTEDLYCDIALEEEEMFQMIELVMQYMRVYVDKWLEMDIDAMTFGDDWGTQISRQQTLPFGTPEDIYAAAETMKKELFRNGGLIGQSEVGGDVSLENVEAVLTAWNR